MKADYHIHSNFSDSSRSVKEILEVAEKEKIKIISICDHDTTEGTKLALELGQHSPVSVIAGIEISAFDTLTQKKVHILGYHYKWNADHIENLCESTLKRRNMNSLWQIKQLQQMGIEITEEEVIRKAKVGKVIYKQHILDCLIEKGIMDEIYGDFYKKVFKNGGPCDKDILYPTVEEAIKAIINDGGMAVLAHPVLSGVVDEIERYQQMGIEGIETYHSSHQPNSVIKLNKIARKLGLIELGGSDNHGRYGNEPEIGVVALKIEDNYE